MFSLLRNVIGRDNAAINCVTVQHKKFNSGSTLTDHSTRVSVMNGKFRFVVHRLWQHRSSNGDREGCDDHLRHYRDAPISAVPLQHRRHPCQELQVDVRQVLLVLRLLWRSVATPCFTPSPVGASAAGVSWRFHRRWLEGERKLFAHYSSHFLHSLGLEKRNEK